MLKISKFLIFLCGLLVPSSDALILPWLLSLTRNEFLNEGFLLDQKTAELQESLKNDLHRSAGLLSAVDSRLANAASSVEVQVKDPQLLGVSLQQSPDNQETHLQIPLALDLNMNFAFLGSVAFHVQADMAVRPEVTKDANDRYHLNFRNCKLLPESLKIQTKAQANLKPIAEITQRTLRLTIANDLEKTICPLIDQDQHIREEAANLLAQQKNLQLRI